MNSRQNKKSLTTKKILAETLIKLLEEHSYSEITILQLCQYSYVARASFYRNFKSIDEVLLFYINEIINQKIPDFNDHRRLFFKAEESMEIWYDQKQLLKLLFDNDIFHLFTKQLNSTINEAFKTIIGESDDPYYDYLATEMAYIISSTFYKWTERNFRENKVEMMELLDRIHLSRATRSILNKQSKINK